VQLRIFVSSTNPADYFYGILRLFGPHDVVVSWGEQTPSFKEAKIVVAMTFDFRLDRNNLEQFIIMCFKSRADK